MKNIPISTTKDQPFKDCFYVKDQERIKVKYLVPAVDSVEAEDGDYTATILFQPHEPVPGGPRVYNDSTTVDQDFRGFTSLYVPPKESGPIIAE